MIPKQSYRIVTKDKHKEYFVATKDKLREYSVLFEKFDYLLISR
jgi:hypothetical protein